MNHILLHTERTIAGFIFIMVCTILHIQAQTAIPAMTAHFPLDETGTEVADVITGTKGTLASGSEWIPGKFGGAMSIKAGTHIPHNAAYDFGEESFSIAFWMRTAKDMSARHPHPLCKGDYDSGELGKGVRWEFHMQNGNFHFTIDDGSVKSETTLPQETFITGDWLHIVGVRDSEQKKLLTYANGELIGDSEDASGSLANPVDLVIGDASRDDNYLPGDLDDIRFFRLVLTKEQIAAVMEANATSIENKRIFQDHNKLTFSTPGLGKTLLLDNTGFHSIEIANVRGKVIRILTVSPHISWNGIGRTGEMVESGVYMLRLMGKGRYSRHRIVLAR